MCRSLTRRVLALAMLAPAFTLALLADGGHWPIDGAHSRVTFSVTKWGFAEVEGRFPDFSGSITYNPAQPALSHIEWRVRVATVVTGDVKRDRSLQAAEYFDARRYPELMFASSSVRRVSDTEMDVTGTITIRGAAQPLTVRVTYGGHHTVPGEGRYETFKTSFTVNRYDFGVVGGRLLGPAISKDVTIHLRAVTKQPGK